MVTQNFNIPPQQIYFHTHVSIIDTKSAFKFSYFAIQGYGKQKKEIVITEVKKFESKPTIATFNRTFRN